MVRHEISNESLALALGLVVIALLVSSRERLALEKDIVWSVVRAIVQLTIVGYVLKYIFDLSSGPITVLMVLFICVNAALNAKKRSRGIDRGFLISFVAIAAGTALTLIILVLSRAIEFMPMQVIPVSGMIAGNAMVAVGLCFNHLNQRFTDNRQRIEEMLSLGADIRMTSGKIVRDSIRAAMIPTVDAAKTVGLVSLPGMMSGLIFAGVDPVQAVKYQIMVTFMLLGTASLSTIIAGYLASRRYYTSRMQLK